MTPSGPSLPGPLHAPGASLPFKIMGGLAALMVLFVVVGFVLPGRWTAERSAVLGTTPARLFPYLSSPARWDAWTPWGTVDSKLEGPAEGAGARRSWSDSEQGQGFLEIVDTRRDRQVRYRVSVDEGAIEVRGRIDLEPVPEGTRVDWVERGDFGWNPLLGYVALFMNRSQGAQMSRSLERLERAALGEDGPG